MALSESQKQEAKDLFAKGYSTSEVFRHFGAQSIGQDSSVDIKESAIAGADQKPALKPLSKKITGILGLDNATQTFGDVISRSRLGNMMQTPEQAQAAQINADVTGQPVMSQQEVNQAQIEAPTKGQIAGATLQSAATAVSPAIAPIGLAAGMAAGAGLGYAYDVGSDLMEQKSTSEVLTPGFATGAGAAVPPLLKGAGAFLRNRSGDAVEGGVERLGTDFDMPNQSVMTDGQSLPPGATQESASTMGDAAQESVSNTASGIAQRAREFAQRFPRAARRIGENIDEGRAIAARRETGTPQVVNALDEGIKLDTIDFVQNFDQPTRNAAIEMFDLAEGGRGAALPQTVPGRIAGDQLDLIDTQRQSIGQQIGEFSDSLSNQPQDILPAVRNLRIVLDQNGIKPFADGRLVFDNMAITPKQQGILQELYNLSTRTTEMSPKQIHQMDQLFSKLQREARFEGVDDVFIKVPTPDGQIETNIYKVFRDVFSQKLDEVAEQAGRGDIKALNREYRTLRNLQDNVEDTIVKQSRRDGVTVDPSESAAVSLRRLFSNAQSKAEYQEIYDQLDAVSRSLGYEGARADTLMDFYLTDMKPLYPDSVPQASFEGGIRGAVSGIVDRIADLGSPNVTDQQKALRALLEASEDTSTSF